jgi:hypothetical protein
MYLNRHWDGKFSQRKSPTLFYPLLARIADKERAEAMIQHLKNPKEFWGKYVLPTVSKDDSSFPDQHYWRGKIWPPTNYLVYQGLKRFGYDETALQFAKKSVRLFLRNWERDKGCYENYFSEGKGNSVKHYTWGALLCLIGLEELIDSEPWGGLRIGSMMEKKASVRRILMHGVPWDVLIDEKGLVCRKKSKTLFSMNGSAVIRDFREKNDGSVTFEIFARRSVRFSWHASALQSAKMDEEDLVILRGPQPSIEISPGKHRIQLLTLTRLND